MAKAPDGGGPEQTTLIFPKKSHWEELQTAKRTAKQRATSANGTFSKVVTRLVDEGHMDRRAARMVLALDAIEDDGDLHVTVFHLIDGLKKLGIMKRAMAQEEMFGSETDTVRMASDAVKAARADKGKKKGDDAPAGGRGGATVSHIGDAARKVAEAAGADKT